MFKGCQKPVLSLFAALFSLSIWMCFLVPNARALTCNGPTDIAVGGTVGFEAMEDPANTARLRATCRVRLYIHDYSWNRLPTEQAREAVLNAFAGTGPESVELGAAKNPAKYWKTYYTLIYLHRGVKADQVDVNAASTISFASWKAFVDGGRAVGVKVVSLVFAPNTNQWKGAPFTDSKWDYIREKALYGGGLTVDSPPSYFLSQPPGYRTFVEAELRWARNHGIQAILIMSPSISGDAFGDDSIKMLTQLGSDNSLPTFEIVENYRPLPVAPGYLNSIGNENNPNSINGVALWVAQHPNP